MHLSDEQLLMLADGELPEGDAVSARGHMQACWTCREKMAVLENTINAFIRERNEELAERVPSAAGPRALLRARMAEMAAGQRPRRAEWLVGRVLAAAACVCVVAGTVVLLEIRARAEGPRPNAAMTPGETRPISLAEVCSHPTAEVVVQDISLETRQRVLEKYGVRSGVPGDFEVDYLITPDLGGAETVRNLWPQPYSARWNAKVKDRLEQRLHDLVCAGKVDLETAQRDIATDWIGAYKKYVGR
ncbi:MAG: hypothetical protein JWN34_6364 [Bryobacterales bacterium]|jgi:hypothetical protein|nr:hypothetical protein [Bryobacterales bacterium]